MLFEELEKAFSSTVESGSLAEAFAAWRSNHPALRRYSDPHALIADFRDETVSYESTEDSLFALCRVVQEGDDLATALLLELYMPSLRRTVKENRARSPLALEDLESAAVEGFLETARILGPDTAKPHKALTSAARAAALRAVRSAREPRAEPRAEVPETAPASGAEEEWFTQIELAGDPKKIIDDAERLGVISNFDARVIEVTQLGEVSLQEFARWVGMSYGAVRQRRSRAEGKLVGWLWVRARLPGKPPRRRT